MSKSQYSHSYSDLKNTTTKQSRRSSQRLIQFVQVCAIRAPGFGDNRKNNLQDIAVLTGGQVISEEVGLKLETTDIKQLGFAKKVSVSADDSIILDGAGGKGMWRCKDITKGHHTNLFSQRLSRSDASSYKMPLRALLPITRGRSCKRGLLSSLAVLQSSKLAVGLKSR